MNEFRVFRLSSLYWKAMYESFFDLEHGLKYDFRPNIIGDKGYPLLPWFVIFHKQIVNVQHTILKTFYNKHLSRGMVVVENKFGIVKKTFKELLLKRNLHILFLLDIVTC